MVQQKRASNAATHSGHNATEDSDRLIGIACPAKAQWSDIAASLFDTPGLPAGPAASCYGTRSHIRTKFSVEAPRLSRYFWASPMVRMSSNTGRNRPMCPKPCFWYHSRYSVEG